MIETLQTLVDATRKTLQDPTDTKQAFRIAKALSFRGPERVASRYRRTTVGARRLATRTPLLDSLKNRVALEAMPVGSLAWHYIRFLDHEGITPDGLVEASRAAEDQHPDPEVEFVGSEMRDMHDLWHIVTGYQTDLLGEAALLAFSSAQLRHPGVGFLAAVGVVLADMPYYRHFIIDGFKRGRQAAWLPAQPWEQLLPKPLEEVRALLGIEAVGPYAEVRDAPIVRLGAAA